MIIDEIASLEALLKDNELLESNGRSQGALVVVSFCIK